MINFTAQRLAWLLYLAVFLGGMSLIFMLTIEYRQARGLIESNQTLMRDTVLKTWMNIINEQVQHYPQNLQQLENQWRSIPTDLRFAYQDLWVYPFRFTGTASANTSELWRNYQQGISGKFNLPEKNASASELRISAIAKIKQQIVANQDITQVTRAYFSLLENYPLSPLEEVVAGLSLLSLGEQSRWNNQLIELYLLHGTQQWKGLTEHLIRDNREFTQGDLRLSIKQIQTLLEKTNIDATWFNQQASYLVETPPVLPLAQLKNYSFINQRQLFIRTTDNLQMIIPYSLQHGLDIVAAHLKSQGILASDDQILLLHSSSAKVDFPLAELPIEVQRQVWEAQRQQQIYFFAIKVIMAIIFMLSLAGIIAFIVYRNNKKLEFINLKESFVNLVSHELKTPLSSIRIMAETIQKRADRKLSIKDYPARVIDEVDRLWLMVENLLSLNQIKSGELTLNIDRVNLTQIIHRVAEKFHAKDKALLSLKLNFPTNISIDVDPLLFELVLINLFSNAIKYADKNSVELTLQFDPASNQLTLTDNACGIPPADWNKVFTSFYRVATQSAKKGSGIGLFLCQQIMQIHQGAISIEQSSATGTTWVIQLCVDKADKLEKYNE